LVFLSGRLFFFPEGLLPPVKCLCGHHQPARRAFFLEDMRDLFEDFKPPLFIPVFRSSVSFPLARSVAPCGFDGYLRDPSFMSVFAPLFRALRPAFPPPFEWFLITETSFFESEMLPSRGVPPLPRSFPFTRPAIQMTLAQDPTSPQLPRTQWTIDLSLFSFACVTSFFAIPPLLFRFLNLASPLF